MFDDFGFVTTLIAIVAFIFARKARNEVKVLSARLDAFEAAATSSASVPAATTATPLTDVSGAPVSSTVETSSEITEERAPTNQPDISSQPIPETAAPAAASQPGPGFEERIGTRWVVWVGGLTLALGGFFMVRYSIEAGLLGPGVRVLLGGLFALALLVVGEWSRRQENLSAIAPLPIANIPAILTAAGTAVAFATVYAAYALYDFLVPATAFILLGIVAMATMAAALLHGPALAGLGIAAAFVTPILVSSSKPDYWALYLYLSVVAAAAFGLARIRLWRWLAVTTIVFATLWTLPGLESGPSMVGPHAFHVLAGFLLASLLVVCGFMYGPPAEEGKIESISSGALSAYLFGATLIVLNSFHADTAMVTFGLLVAATLFVAWYAQAATAAVAVAAGFVALVFLEWAVRGNPDMLVLPGGPLAGIGPNATDGSVSLHLISAAIFAVGFGVVGFLAQGRSISAIVPVIWSGTAVFTPLALLIALYARIAHLDRSIPFAILAVIVAAGFAAATEWLSKREARPGQAISIALFATGTLGALALALTFALEKGWLTIALSLMALGTAWISMQRPIPFLRWLAAILAGIVVARMGYEPRVVGDLVGTTPIFNWLLWGYGVPAASFWGASILMRRRGDDAPLRMVESAAILFTVLLAFMEIRHAINGGDVYRNSAGLVEVALQVCVTLAMAIGLEWLRIRTGSIVHNIGAVLLTLYAGVATIGGLLLWEMPMFWPHDVGGLIFNEILLGYALPAVLALLLSYAVAGRRAVAYANTIAGFALVLALMYVALQVRRFYHGPILARGITSDAEQYTYSVTWLAFGVILLGIGVIFNSQRARLASAIVIALTILKAFLIDMSALTGIYRALSFMCLGLVLVAIGWLYQRILFSRRTQPPAAPVGTIPEA
ncbi:putative membrane protein [Nitrobacteraceae bacterium AZCC 2146]